ncbi:hypothetical protein PFISCL1PPCAC_20259, partial [Pristionchus fissidentatus]
LSLHSPFFFTLFHGEFKEKHQSEIRIEDVDPEEFIMVLNLLYRIDQPITEENVENLLKLADKFQISVVIDDAERFLLRSSMSIHKRLLLADQYKLAVLRRCMLDRYNGPGIKQLKNSAEYRLLSDEMKDVLFDKLIKISVPDDD